MRLQAAKRLSTVAAVDSTAAYVEEAAFDNTRIDELHELRKILHTKGDLMFRLADARLVRESTPYEVAEECTLCTKILNNEGWVLQVDYPTIFRRPTFGLKGKDGIVLQKVNTTMRIFFTR